VRLGRAPNLPRAVERRIVRERKSGATLAAIAERLNRDKVATSQGGVRWYPGTVRVVLRGLAASS
jgi:hypothetical protein